MKACVVCEMWERRITRAQLKGKNDQELAKALKFHKKVEHDEEEVLFHHAAT